MVQLFDSGQFDTAPHIVADRCQLRFKSTECGSVGAATTCNHLFTTCSDGTHNAPERFRAVLSMTPGALIYPPTVDSGASIGGGRDGDGGGETGRKENVL